MIRVVDRRRGVRRRGGAIDERVVLVPLVAQRGAGRGDGEGSRAALQDGYVIRLVGDHRRVQKDRQRDRVTFIEPGRVGDHALVGRQMIGVYRGRRGVGRRGRTGDGLIILVPLVGEIRPLGRDAEGSGLALGHGGVRGMGRDQGEGHSIQFRARTDIDITSQEHARGDGAGLDMQGAVGYENICGDFVALPHDRRKRGGGGAADAAVGAFNEQANIRDADTRTRRRAQVCGDSGLQPLFDANLARRRALHARPVAQIERE